MQHIAIRFAERMRQHAIANEAAIDESVLRGATLRGKRRPHGEAGQTYAACCRIDERRMNDECIGKERFDAGAAAACDKPMRDAAIVLQRQALFRMSECNSSERFVAMRPLSTFGAQELAPRGRVEVELLDGDCRASGERCGGNRTHRPAFDFDAPRMRPPIGARGERETRHGGDRCQRFTAKSKRRDRLEIGDRGDFRCRMPRDCERKVFAFDAGAVVGYAQALDAAASEVDINLRRARVKAVFEHLLQRGGRPLDDFAGGDLVDQQIGQRANRVHRHGRRLRDQRV